MTTPPSNIPDEAAVEAVMSALGERYGEYAYCREREYVVTALEAAAPYIRAQALEDAAGVWGPTGTATWLHARADSERPAP